MWTFLLAESIFISIQILFTLLPAVLVLKCDLPPGSSMLILCEQTRFIMKSHAFLRSNVVKAFVQTSVTPNATSSRKGSYSTQSCHDREEMSQPVKAEKVKQYLCDIDKSTKMSSGSVCPSFSHYVYFLFIPTLVYRDSYPRTDHIRWHYVASNFTQVLFCIIYNYFIFTKFLISRLKSFNHHNFTVSDITLCVTGSMLPSGLLFLIVFFAMLHSWMNAFAELLRFGDRLFYKDWWNSKSFNAFYRNWNVVVHDWLYTYVYVDSYKVLKNKAAATFVVFFISSYVHEYIISLTFKFCYPVILIQFGGAGFLLTFLRFNGRFGNINFWISMLMGLGIQVALYAMEYYARQICRPVYDDTPFWDFFVPRSWYCLPK